MKNSVIVSMLRKLICCVFLLWVELTTTACKIIFIASQTSGKYPTKKKKLSFKTAFNSASTTGRKFGRFPVSEARQR